MIVQISKIVIGGAYPNGTYFTVHAFLLKHNKGYPVRKEIGPAINISH